LIVLLSSHAALAQTAPGSGPPPAVTTVVVEARDIAPTTEFIGRVEAIQSFDARPRIEGFLREVAFSDGHDVKAQATYQRTEELRGRGNVSEAQLDEATAVRDVAQADVLAAQAAVRIVPLSVVLSVAAAGAAAGLWLTGIPVDIYAQIGFVLLIGLAAKNAILIVEFARTRREHGLPVIEAAVEGARTCFRAVLMTAIAFILGVVPLLAATGAGAASRRSIGTTVLSGMMAATIVGIVFVPILFTVFKRVSEGLTRRGDRRHEAAPAE
jgi:Cu/Ag efflux pump CusA